MGLRPYRYERSIDGSRVVLTHWGSGMTVLDLAAETDAIRRNQMEWGNAWAAKDARAILSHYAPDAVLIVPGEPPVRGVDAYSRIIKEAVDSSHFSLSWTVDDISIAASGDLSCVLGSYVQHNPSADGGFTVETGSYVTVLKKMLGRWLAVIEINTPGG